MSKMTFEQRIETLKKLLTLGASFEKLHQKGASYEELLAVGASLDMLRALGASIDLLCDIALGNTTPGQATAAADGMSETTFHHSASDRPDGRSVRWITGAAYCRNQGLDIGCQAMSIGKLCSNMLMRENYTNIPADASLPGRLRKYPLWIVERVVKEKNLRRIGRQ